jgi:hypothetical protein
MKETKKKMYESPQLTVVTFKTERGYANSINLQIYTGDLRLISRKSYGDATLENGGIQSWF